ncbi:MAG: hypothetical protein R3C39_10850 [Dehalococcoidia bacterium]
MSPVDTKELLESVYDEEFGFRLTNFSIKPVHVANGLARALAGRTYDTTAVTRLVRRYVRNQKLGVDEERYPNTEVIADYASAFATPRGREPDALKVTRLRSLAFDVLAADGAVFPTQQSFTLSNERFITGDLSDVRMGLFLSRLLTAEPTSRRDAATYLLELLQSESDPLTTLALPVLEFGEAQEEIPSAEVAERIAKSEHLFEASNGQLVSPTLRNLRDAYDRLARFERHSGSKLNSLRRLMLFGCFVLHVHAVSRWSEREGDAPRPPILLDLFDGTLISVADASRATLRAAGDAIEGVIRSRFHEQVLADFGATGKQIETALMESGLGDRVESLYRTYCEGGTEAADALARAMAEDALDREREAPIGSLIELGRRAGFLTPWSNQGRGGKLRKRYTATAEFLETLVAATVEPNDPVEFPEFLERLRDDFGIVVGRPEDDAIIRHTNLRDEEFWPAIVSINEEDLRRNVEEFRELLVESGYGKAYADGRTMVTTRPEGSL